MLIKFGRDSVDKIVLALYILQYLFFEHENSIISAILDIGPPAPKHNTQARFFAGL